VVESSANLRIVSFDQFSAPPEELLRRALESPKSNLTSHCLLICEDDAVGFLAIDRSDSELGIYEIWIRSDYRKRGFARAALRLIEEIAASEHRHSLWVRPKPLAVGTTGEGLLRLYKRAGYLVDPADSGLWRKHLAPEAAS
jgi:GNAT superfamily N-acetyltransferase